MSYIVVERETLDTVVRAINYARLFVNKRYIELEASSSDRRIANNVMTDLNDAHARLNQEISDAE